MPIPIELYSDFACPYCFLADVVLQQATAGKDVSVERMPFELRPYPAPTLRPEGQFVQNAWRNSVAPLATRLGIEIRVPAVSPLPYTRLAFEGLEFAKDHRKAAEYFGRVMRGMWQESQDIGDPAVLARLASEIGLSADAFHSALDTRQYRDRVEKLLHHAYQEMAVTGVPVFVIGDCMLTGVQSRETLTSSIDQALSASTTAAKRSVASEN